MNHWEVCKENFVDGNFNMNFAKICRTDLVVRNAGMHAWLAAAADTRYAVVVPIIGVQVVCLAHYLYAYIVQVQPSHCLCNYDRGFDGQ